MKENDGNLEYRVILAPWQRGSQNDPGLESDTIVKTRSLATVMIKLVVCILTRPTGSSKVYL